MDKTLSESRIVHHIHLIRERRVILDADLARLYGVETKALNQAVKRNQGRFPEDFAFRLNRRERKEVVTNCDHLQSLRFSKALPRAFTEHGALMAANVLNSPRAIGMSVVVTRAFVRMREILSLHHDLAKRLDALEQKYDGQFRVVFDAIRELITPQETKPPRIGFLTQGGKSLNDMRAPIRRGGASPKKAHAHKGIRGRLERGGAEETRRMTKVGIAD